MSCKPILFNTEMVQAIKEGRKTQTRRIIKPQPVWDGISCFHISKYGCWEEGRNDRIFSAEDNWPINTGDILWVRETWQHVFNLDDNDQAIEGTGRYIYFADNTMPFDYWVDTDTGEHKDQMPWRPSIHMPKEAARIFLRVKDVRIERLQDMTEEQAEKEGCSAGYWNITCGPFGNDDDPDEWTAIEHFQKVWDSTIKPADREWYGWDANPWVWVIEFEKCERPDDFL